MASSLKVKLMVPMIGLSTLTLGLIIAYSSVSHGHLASLLGQQRMEATSGFALEWLDATKAESMSAALIVSGSGVVISGLDDWNANVNREAARRGLISFLTVQARNMVGVDSFQVRDRDGVTVLNLHDPNGNDYSDGIASGLDALNGITTQNYTAMPGMPMGLVTTMPIRSDDGTIAGTITAFTFMYTDEFVDKVAQTFDATVTVFSGRTRAATTLVQENGQRAVGLDAPEEVSSAVLGRGETYSSTVSVLGQRYMAYYFPLNDSNGAPAGIFSVGFSQEGVFAANLASRRSLIAIGIVGLVAMTAVMLLLIVRAVRPIDLMARALKDIAIGDGDLTVSLPEGAGGEIGQAALYFNRTMGKIRELVASIKTQAVVLSEIGNDLAGNMGETAAAMNEIAANIRSIKTRVINQSASVTETNATMEQVTVNIEKLSGSVQTQTHAVSQSSSAIEEMLANIQSVTAILVKNAANVVALRESSDSGRTSVQEVAGDIQEIAHESEGLMEINSVMENIASQTNLLSMNAAIEAAHAGEAGKGFAVVADEIRKLAESSSEQSKTIGTVLKKIKGSIDKITRSTDDVLQKFEAIDHGVKTVAEQEEVIRAAMEEQGEGSRQVLEASEQVSEITQQVKGGSQEMLEGSREVIQEGRNLELTTQEITDGINEMATGADEVNRAVNSVNDLTGRNREKISVLVQSVSHFKV